MIMIQ